MSFSVGVKLTDLNDHIAPAQACVKPTTGSTDQKLKLAAISLGEEKQLENMKNATISLADCLACSGCITSAETVLIKAQSVEEFEKRIESEKYTVVSLSMESIVAITKNYGMGYDETYKRLITFFKSLGAKEVIDTNFACVISRELTFYEYQCRLQSLLSSSSTTTPSSTSTSTSSTSSFTPPSTKTTTTSSSSSPVLPLLSGWCPGVVCYVEKTHPALLPHLPHTTPPPPALARTRHQGHHDKIYHVTVMPCFDRKLEASREEYTVDGKPLIDTVLSTFEVVDLIEKKGKPLNEYPLGEVSSIASAPPRMCDAQILASRLSSEKVEFKAGRNADLLEAKVRIEGVGEVPFTIARGFRNIQNVIRKVKTQGQKNYGFIEIAACPRGCLDGGGQIRAKNGKQLELVAELEQLLAETKSELPSCEEVAQRVVKELYGVDINTREGVKKLFEMPEFQTQYHSREEAKNPLEIQW